MGVAADPDWIALYGAGLSTVILMATVVRWLLNGPRLKVFVFNPNESNIEKHGAFLAIVSNAGTVATVVHKLEISFRTARWRGREIRNAEFGERSNWNPSVKLVPTPDKTNNFTREPNVIHHNEEIRANASPIKTYDASTHWIRVSATPRGSRRKFVDWAGPSAPRPLVEDQR